MDETPNTIQPKQSDRAREQIDDAGDPLGGQTPRQKEAPLNRPDKFDPFGHCDSPPEAMDETWDVDEDELGVKADDGDASDAPNGDPLEDEDY